MTLRIPPVRIHFPEEDREAILQQSGEALTSGRLPLGKHGKALEERFAACTGTKYAMAVNSSTSAIEIPLRIFDVLDKTVLVPTNTFFATLAAVLHAALNVCDGEITKSQDITQEIPGFPRRS